MPRLTVDITREQQYGLRKHLEFGMQKTLFSLIIDDLLRLFDKHGPGIVIGAMVSRAISLKEICQLEMETDDNNRRP